MDLPALEELLTRIKSLPVRDSSHPFFAALN